VIDMSELPLSHLTVLDLTAHRAGPTAVRQLADWGAHVIKIEPPPPPSDGGKNDSMGGARHGFDFQNLHRNKKAMTLNLKSKEGHAIFMKLAEKADVIVENYRSDVKHRLHVDYDTVAKVNPRIVYGSIAGFGQSGPDAARPGVDQIAQGMGGLMSITGEPGRGPMRVGIPIADLTSGLLLAQAIMLALYNRERTGKGQWVHTSLIEAQIFMLDFQASRWLMKGEVAKQAGNDHPTSIPTGVFPTSDGFINIAAAGDSMWKRAAKALGAPALIDHPEHATPALRSQNRKALNERLAEVTRTNTSAHWIEALNKAGVPFGPINTIDKTFAEPQVQHLGIARAIKHSKLGDIKVVGQPINLSDSPQPRELKPTPDLGEHTDEVLTNLGYDKKAIEGLRAGGVI
jgi:crotonobetainyl-CoA:carnitine CoA-transferase CaiB-like acyl-CoA transferase